MENILDIDVNSMLTKAISKKIDEMESEISELSSRNAARLREISELKDKLAEQTNKFENAISLTESMRRAFSEIKESERREGDWYDSKQKIQFLYICDIMLFLHNVRPACKWQSSRNNGRLAPYLAVAFHEHKDDVITLLKILIKDSASIASFISNFKMPYEYSQKEVIDFLKSPESCTKGSYFDERHFWIEYGAGKKNVPYDLMLKNPHVVSKEVFPILIERIELGYGESMYFYEVSRYNKNITSEQICEIGRTLIGLREKQLELLKSFIFREIKHFDAETLEYLYQFIRNSKYNTWDFRNFLVEQQQRFLMSLPFEAIYDIVKESGWDMAQKETFLTKYFLRDLYVK